MILTPGMGVGWGPFRNKIPKYFKTSQKHILKRKPIFFPLEGNFDIDAGDGGNPTNPQTIHKKLNHIKNTLKLYIYFNIIYTMFYIIYFLFLYFECSVYIIFLYGVQYNQPVLDVFVISPTAKRVRRIYKTITRDG